MTDNDWLSHDSIASATRLVESFITYKRSAENPTLFNDACNLLSAVYKKVTAQYVNPTGIENPNASKPHPLEQSPERPAERLSVGPSECLDPERYLG